jgi:hypothetical protein
VINIHECVGCYNRYHGNAVTGFWASYFPNMSWFVGDNLLLRYFGSDGIILVRCVVL